jgi:hypothetical protein
MDYLETQPSLGYAKQKFFEALYALIGVSTIDQRLTYAASYLVHLEAKDLPAACRGEHPPRHRLMRHSHSAVAISLHGGALSLRAVWPAESHPCTQTPCRSDRSRALR